MSWYDFLIWATGASGCVGGFYSLYTARTQKKKLQVEVTQLLNDEWETLFDKLKQDTSTQIERLESKIYKLEIKDAIKNRAINQFIKCSYVQRGNGCPVMSFMEETDDILRNRLTPEQIAELNGKQN